MYKNQHFAAVAFRNSKIYINKTCCYYSEPFLLIFNSEKYKQYSILFYFTLASIIIQILPFVYLSNRVNMFTIAGFCREDLANGRLGLLQWELLCERQNPPRPCCCKLKGNCCNIPFALVRMQKRESLQIPLLTENLSPRYLQYTRNCILELVQQVD